MYRTTTRTQLFNLDSKLTNGKINLALTGFDRQKLISLDELKKLVTSVPHHHLAGLAEISYQPVEQTLYPGLSRAHLCAAEYIQELRKIVIYKAADKSTLKHIIAHEIGHYVFHRIIDQKLRYSWVNQVSPQAKYVTKYAQTNASEDFAECYAVYLLDENALKAISLKYQFLQTHIFAK
jgi:hypothetical protein